MCATGRTKTDYLQIDAIGKLKVTSLQIPLWFEDFLRPPPPSPHNPPPHRKSLWPHTRFPRHFIPFHPIPLPCNAAETPRHVTRTEARAGVKAIKPAAGGEASPRHLSIKYIASGGRLAGTTKRLICFLCGGDNSCRNNHETRDVEENGRRRGDKGKKKRGRGEEGKEGKEGKEGGWKGGRREERLVICLR